MYGRRYLQMSAIHSGGTFLCDSPSFFISDQVFKVELGSPLCVITDDLAASVDPVLIGHKSFKADGTW